MREQGKNRHGQPVLVEFAHRIQRYSKLFTFLGASIVLLTFAVKEGWRESVKDLAETVDSAQNIYTLRADGLATASQLNGLTSEVEAIRAKVEDNQFGMTLPGINRSMLLYSGQLHQLEASTDNLSRLNEKLATKEPFQPRMTDIQSQIETEQVAFREIGVATVRVAPKADERGTLPTEDARAISKQIFDFSAKLVLLDREIATLTSDILANAQSEYENREKSFRRATWLSYFLYGAGWLLGLFGRLTGLNGPEIDS
jgi:hypothetical protein